MPTYPNARCVARPRSAQVFCVRARATDPPRALRAQTLASVIGNLDSLLRAGLVAVMASWLMQAYMGRVFKVLVGLADDLWFDL